MCPPENCLCCQLYNGVKFCTMLYAFLCIWTMINLFSLRTQTKFLCGEADWDKSTAACTPNDVICGADSCAPWAPMTADEIAHLSATCSKDAWGPKRLGDYCGSPNENGSWVENEEKFTCCEGWPNTEDPDQLKWCSDGRRPSDQAAMARVAVQFWGWAVLVYCWYYGIGQFDALRIERLWKLFTAVCIMDHVLSFSYMVRADDFSAHPHMNIYGVAFAAGCQIWFIAAVKSLSEQVKAGIISEQNIHGTAIHQFNGQRGQVMMGANGQMMMNGAPPGFGQQGHQGQMMYPPMRQQLSPVMHVQGQFVGHVGEQNPVMAMPTVSAGMPTGQAQPIVQGQVVQGQVMRGP